MTVILREVTEGNNSILGYVDQTVDRILKKEATDRADKLAPWESRVSLVSHASGILGNGGFRYFVEQGLDAERTASAYEAVGLVNAADLIKSITGIDV